MHRSKIRQTSAIPDPFIDFSDKDVSLVESLFCRLKYTQIW